MSESKSWEQFLIILEDDNTDNHKKKLTVNTRSRQRVKSLLFNQPSADQKNIVVPEIQPQQFENKSLSWLKNKLMKMTKSELVAFFNKFRIDNGIGPRVYKCNLCNYVSNSERYGFQCFRLHYNLHFSKSMFQCTQCDYMVRTKGNLLNHINNKHNDNKKLQCPECPATFVYKSALKMHVLRVHKKAKNYMCNKCPKRYFTKAEARDHINRHLNKREHKCPICSKEFFSRKCMTEHVRLTHCHENQFECSECGTRYKTKKTFINHGLKAHSAEINWYPIPLPPKDMPFINLFLSDANSNNTQ